MSESEGNNRVNNKVNNKEQNMDNNKIKKSSVLMMMIGTITNIFKKHD